MNPRPRRRPGRIMIYSHDTYGLGHLRRNLLICEGFTRLPDAPSVLLATGSPRAQAFDLPEGCDTFKLPAVLKQADGTYRARTLPMSFEEIKEIRSEMLRNAFRCFGPDLLLVDHAPAGVEGELLPLLREIHRLPPEARPATVLGLRDIIDEADRVREQWTRLGVWEDLGGIYDRFLVYGDPSIVTTAQELELEARCPGRVRHTGYLGRPVCAGRPAASHGSEPLLLVTAGGGGDGHWLLRTFASFLEGLGGPAPFRTVVVTGPFLSRQRFDEVSSRLRATPHRVAVLRFTNRMEELVESAAAMISMGGYNSIVEILTAGVPALVVPRVNPRREQLIRAERLAPRAPIECCRPDRLSPDVMASFVERVLSGGLCAARPGVDLDGLGTATHEILGALAARGAAVEPPPVEGGRHASRIG